MTNKEQIIINGVNVSGCEYLINELEEDGRYYWFCKNSPIGGPDDCEENANCHFKQLQRKAQECKQKDKTIAGLVGCVSLWEEFSDEESRLAKSSSIADLVVLLRQKTAECEALKEKYKWYDHYKDSALANKDLCNKKIDEIGRCREALDDIEITIAALHFRTLPFQRGITHELADIVQYYKNIIRDIISKAKKDK